MELRSRGETRRQAAWLAAAAFLGRLSFQRRCSHQYCSGAWRMICFQPRGVPLRQIADARHAAADRRAGRSSPRCPTRSATAGPAARRIARPTRASLLQRQQRDRLVGRGRAGRRTRPSSPWGRRTDRPGRSACRRRQHVQSICCVAAVLGKMCWPVAPRKLVDEAIEIADCRAAGRSCTWETRECPARSRRARNCRSGPTTITVGRSLKSCRTSIVLAGELDVVAPVRLVNLPRAWATSQTSRNRCSHIRRAEPLPLGGRHLGKGVREILVDHAAGEPLVSCRPASPGRATWPRTCGPAAPG